MASNFDVGDKARVRILIEVDSAYVDPAALEIRVEKPSGVKTTYVFGVDPELVQEGVGMYHIDIDLDEGGEWEYYWVGTNPAQFAEPGVFYVRGERVT